MFSLLYDLTRNGAPTLFVVVLQENNLNLSIRVSQLESEGRLAGHYLAEK